MRRFLCVFLLIVGCAGSKQAQREDEEEEEDHRSPKYDKIKNYDFEDDIVEGHLEKPEGDLRDPHKQPSPPVPETVRWAPTKNCTETCRRLAECKLSPGTRTDCGTTCSSADEDEVLLSAFTCYGAARDCNDLLECSRDAP